MEPNDLLLVLFRQEMGDAICEADSVVHSIANPSEIWRYCNSVNEACDRYWKSICESIFLRAYE